MQENGTHIVSFTISLSSVGDRERGLTMICDMMREDLSKYPEIKTFEVNAGGSKHGMAAQAAVDVEVYGYDFATTDKVAAELAKRMMDVKDVAATTISRKDYVPEYQVDFDREKLALNGLNITTASSYLRNRINGATASYYREDGDEYDIKVRYAPEYRQTIADIENIMIYNSQGKGVRVRDVGKVVERMSPPTIERKDRERVVTVSAVLSADGVLGEAVSGVKAEIEKMDIPAGIEMSIGGTYEDQQDIFSDLSMLMALIVILVFIILASQFESLTDPFIIMFSLPFALTGVFIGLALTGTPLSVMAFVGVIMLVGIVVKNGIVLIDYTILNRERGLSVTHAVIHAGKSRLRPVLMTTLTTVFGMIPLAVGTGEGSEMWRSMGTTVAWGLSVSTLITLIIVPVVYCIFAGNGIKRKRRKLAARLADLKKM